MSDQAPKVAVGASADRSPRRAIERWLADVAGNSFSVADYGHLFTEIAAVEPKRVVAAKLERAGRSLSHHPGRKRMDPVPVITRIIRMIEKGTPRSAAILMVAKLRARPTERVEVGREEIEGFSGKIRGRNNRLRIEFVAKRTRVNTIRKVDSWEQA